MEAAAADADAAAALCERCTLHCTYIIVLLINSFQSHSSPILPPAMDKLKFPVADCSDNARTLLFLPAVRNKIGHALMLTVNTMREQGKMLRNSIY